VTDFGVEEALFLTLLRAEDKLSRLDERLASSPLAGGWRTRVDLLEAASWAWADGRLAPLEDLVLHDAHMDVRSPTQDLTLAHVLTRARRKAQAGGAELVSADGAYWLIGRAAAPPQASAGPVSPRPTPDAGVLPVMTESLTALRSRATEDPHAAIDEIVGLIAQFHPSTPDLLAAAGLIEGWRLAAPLPRQAWVGPLLAAIWLKSRGRLRSHILTWWWAAKDLPLAGARAEGPLLSRLEHHLLVAERAAELSIAELQRLSLARLRLLQQVGVRRRHSRAGELVDLLIASPLVSAPLAADRLKISQQAVRSLIAQLGAGVQEVSGRRRFQAWRV